MSSKGKKSPARAKKPSENSEEEFAVEKIVDKRERRGVVQYKVRWHGFGSDADTWEDETNLSCDAKVKEFERSRVQPEEEDETEEDDEYEVEKILDKRTRKGKVQYKIRWVGYSAVDDTWENEENLNCAAKVKEFERKKGSK